MWLQPPVMKTDSGVDDGNYCMVYTVLPNLHLVSKLLSQTLTTYILLPDNLLLVFCMKRQAKSYCSFIITEAAQPNAVSHYQGMS